MAWFSAPSIVGGILREESRDLFRRYCATVPDSALRRWIQTLVDPPGRVAPAPVE
ncbi:hypothetical protein [Polymorphospora lycopeni]|uniref:Uncharacterized protein n=1 Tax=Polymorphospora lycopeni TaxID=3140240 RepID=A0ABV5CIU5_9ACTN